MESMFENLNEASRFDYYHNFTYGGGWPRANRGDNVPGCVKPGSFCSHIDLHNMSVKKVVPAVRELQEELAKLPDLTVLNNSGSAFESRREEGTIYFKILQVPQEEMSRDDPRLNLYNGFGAVYGTDRDSIVNDRAMNHPYGRDMEILFQIPGAMYSGSLHDFRRASNKLTYDMIVRDNLKIRDFLRRVLSKTSFDEFYGIKTQAEPIEVRSDAKKLVFAFWVIQKKIKATGHTDSVADLETIKKIRALLDSPEGKSAFGKYYSYARSFIYKNFPGMRVGEALDILEKSGIIYQRGN